MTVDIKRALTVPGWMGDEELFWLATQAQKHERIVEVGTWMGRTTVALAEHALGTVWAVDHFKGGPGFVPELEGKPEDWLYKQFRANVDDPRLGKKCILTVKKSSQEAAKEFHEKNARALIDNHAWGVQLFDMIFIDAAHDYPDVKADILAWRPLLVPGGLLCGHDLRPAYPGVEQAVAELCPGWKKVPGDRSAIWYVPTEKVP
jgi:hypothetical protein